MVEEETYVAVAFDTAGCIHAVTLCDTRKHALKTAAYYRRYYPKARSMTSSEFIKLRDKEREERWKASRRRW